MRIALRTASKQGCMTIRLAAVMPMSISTMAIVRGTMDVSVCGCIVNITPDLEAKKLTLGIACCVGGGVDHDH